MRITIERLRAFTDGFASVRRFDRWKEPLPASPLHADYHAGFTAALTMRGGNAAERRLVEADPFYQAMLGRSPRKSRSH